MKTIWKLLFYFSILLNIEPIFSQVPVKQSDKIDIKLILTEPAKVLKFNNKIMTEAYHQVLKQGITDQAYIRKKSIEELIAINKKINNEWQAKNSIYRLGECIEQCALSRFGRVEYRTAFEQTLSSAILENLLKTDQPVHYASFGSGGLFQDLVVLTKVLSAKPDSKIIVHFIDLKYRPYEFYKEITGTREVDINLPIGSDKKALAELVKKAKSKYADIPDDEVKQSIVGVILEEISLIQLISYIKKNFPLSIVKLNVHSAVDSYLDYISKYKLSYPDIVATADIMDEMGLAANAAADYTKLCIQTLQNKPTSSNVWLLTKSFFSEDAMLGTITLEPIKERKAQEVEVIDPKTKTKVRFYFEDIQKNEDMQPKKF